MQNLKHLPPVIFLMGPTASGKSRIALYLAERFPVEIISVDSAQVYRHMDIGTAKPDVQTLVRIPHHLVDLIDPDRHYSAAQFRSDALKLMQDITQRNKVPLLVGGTMLYFRTLLEGLSVLPPADPVLRTMLENQAKELGWPALHRQLAGLDPDAAVRIKPTDSQRIQRALEVCMLTKQTMTALLQSTKQTDFPFQRISIALQPGDRGQLHCRIALRFESMLAAGLVDEVRYIRRLFPALTQESPAMRCVGYRQVCLYLDGQIDQPQLHDTGIFATRQLAKRQLTWLRGMKTTEGKTFDCLENDIDRQVECYLRSALGDF
ncbi:MAG: tRNA (adenosine(37)-N6)-dimethylallyltransferase MiaA [Nitrosomonas sp.]|nr:MAG: tRNA (adenosine(37)-N6)-dimethylallyltransferase MiaA [Nitrosomonas sp.]